MVNRNNFDKFPELRKADESLVTSHWSLVTLVRQRSSGGSHEPPGTSPSPIYPTYIPGPSPNQQLDFLRRGGLPLFSTTSGIAGGGEASPPTPPLAPGDEPDRVSQLIQANEGDEIEIKNHWVKGRAISLLKVERTAEDVEAGRHRFSVVVGGAGRGVMILWEVENEFRLPVRFELTMDPGGISGFDIQRAITKWFGRKIILVAPGVGAIPRVLIKIPARKPDSNVAGGTAGAPVPEGDPPKDALAGTGVPDVVGEVTDGRRRALDPSHAEGIWRLVVKLFGGADDLDFAMEIFGFVGRTRRRGMVEFRSSLTVVGIIRILDGAVNQVATDINVLEQLSKVGQRPSADFPGPQTLQSRAVILRRLARKVREISPDARIGNERANRIIEDFLRSRGIGLSVVQDGVFVFGNLPQRVQEQLNEDRQRTSTSIRHRGDSVLEQWHRARCIFQQLALFRVPLNKPIFYAVSGIMLGGLQTDYEQMFLQRLFARLEGVSDAVARGQVIAEFLKGLVVDESVILADDIRKAEAHRVGSDIMGYFVSPIEAKRLIAGVFDTLNNPAFHPIVKAAKVYQDILSIHLFRDGNGRAGRFLMDYVLMMHGYPPAMFNVDGIDIANFSEISVQGGADGVVVEADKAYDVPLSQVVRMVEEGVRRAARVISEAGIPYELPDINLPFTKEIDVLTLSFSVSGVLAPAPSGAPVPATPVPNLDSLRGPHGFFGRVTDPDELRRLAGELVASLRVGGHGSRVTGHESRVTGHESRLSASVVVAEVTSREPPFDSAQGRRVTGKPPTVDGRRSMVGANGLPNPPSLRAKQSNPDDSTGSPRPFGARDDKQGASRLDFAHAQWLAKIEDVALRESVKQAFLRGETVEDFRRKGIEILGRSTTVQGLYARVPEGHREEFLTFVGMQIIATRRINVDAFKKQLTHAKIPLLLVGVIGTTGVQVVRPVVGIPGR